MTIYYVTRRVGRIDLVDTKKVSAKLCQKSPAVGKPEEPCLIVNWGTATCVYTNRQFTSDYNIAIIRAHVRLQNHIDKTSRTITELTASGTKPIRLAGLRKRLKRLLKIQAQSSKLFQRRKLVCD